MAPSLLPEPAPALVDRPLIPHREVAELGSRVRGSAPPRRDRERPGVRPAVWGMVAAAAGIVLLAGVAWFGRNALDLPWQDRVNAATRPTLMVLSFAAAGEGAPAYFGPGFAEDLAARLSEIPGGTIVGRSSIREAVFVSDWRARARKAGATFAVRGTIEPGPYALHADVELLDVESGASVWSQHFAREPRQVAAMEAEIAAQLAQQLRLVTPTSNRWARASVRKIDPAAYDLYLQGREAADRRDRARAIGLYDQALQRDPGLVEARAGTVAGDLPGGVLRRGNARNRDVRARAAGGGGRARRGRGTPRRPPRRCTGRAHHHHSRLFARERARLRSLERRGMASRGRPRQRAGPAKSIPFYRASLALEPSIDANWRDLASAYAAAGARRGRGRRWTRRGRAPGPFVVEADARQARRRAGPVRRRPFSCLARTRRWSRRQSSG